MNEVLVLKRNNADKSICAICNTNQTDVHSEFTVFIEGGEKVCYVCVQQRDRKLKAIATSQSLFQNVV